MRLPFLDISCHNVSKTHVQRMSGTLGMGLFS